MHADLQHVGRVDNNNGEHGDESYSSKLERNL